MCMTPVRPPKPPGVADPRRCSIGQCTQQQQSQPADLHCKLMHMHSTGVRNGNVAHINGLDLHACRGHVRAVGIEHLRPPNRQKLITIHQQNCSGSWMGCTRVRVQQVLVQEVSQGYEGLAPPLGQVVLPHFHGHCAPACHCPEVSHVPPAFPGRPALHAAWPPW